MRSWAKEADSDYRGCRHRLSREDFVVVIELQLSYALHLIYVATKKPYASASGEIIMSRPIKSKLSVIPLFLSLFRPELHCREFGSLSARSILQEKAKSYRRLCMPISLTGRTAEHIDFQHRSVLSTNGVTEWHTRYPQYRQNTNPSGGMTKDLLLYP